MASLGMSFDATSVDPIGSFEPLPNGEYMVCITASDMKSTKSGGGQYLELELEVIDGNFKGRKVWDRLNLMNQNSKTVEIAQRQLSALCHAAGIMNVTDSSQLHGIPVIATFKYKEASDGWDATNDVRGYKSASANNPAPQPQQPVAGNQPQSVAQPAAPAPVQQPTPPQQTASRGATPPWGNQ